jgi:hypothetical protein
MTTTDAAEKEAALQSLRSKATKTLSGVVSVLHFLGTVGGLGSLFLLYDRFLPSPDLRLARAPQLRVRYEPTTQEMTFGMSIIVQNTGNGPDTITEFGGRLIAGPAELMRFSATEIDCKSNGQPLPAPFGIPAGEALRLDCEAPLKGAKSHFPLRSGAQVELTLIVVGQEGESPVRFCFDRTSEFWTDMLNATETYELTIVDPTDCEVQR